MISTPMSLLSRNEEKDMEPLDLLMMEEFPSHPKLTRRLQKTLYYGQGYMPKTDRPSLPLTEIAVELFQESSPRELGQVDTYLASSMARKACMSPCSMMLGMIFIERLRSRNPEYLQKVSSSDIFFISMMLASKYLYDEGTDDEVFNDEWAESGDMDLQDLNQLERNFLSAMDWKLYVSASEFWKKLEQIEHRIALEQGCARGWFSYTDMCVLTRDPAIGKLAQAVMAALTKMVLVCSVAYAAAVATLVASAVSTACLRERLNIPVTTGPSAGLPLTAPALSTLCQVSLEADSADTEMSVLTGGQLGGEDAANHNQTGGRQLEPAAKPASVGIPGLLTLALLQDTVCQFIAGATNQFKMLSAGRNNVSKHGTCACASHYSSTAKCSSSTTKNRTFSGEPIKARELRCTCGKKESARKADDMEQVRSPARHEPGIMPAKHVWTKLLKRFGGVDQMKSSSHKTMCRSCKKSESEPTEENAHTTCRLSAPMSCSETRRLPSCAVDLQLPVSELAVMHGHTVPTISIVT